MLRLSRHHLYLTFVDLYFLISIKISELEFWIINLIAGFTEMTKREMTLVYYHVPEDKDDPECPNVYGVPAFKHSINLATIY